MPNSVIDAVDKNPTHSGEVGVILVLVRQIWSFVSSPQLVANKISNLIHRLVHFGFLSCSGLLDSEGVPPCAVGLWQCSRVLSWQGSTSWAAVARNNIPEGSSLW